MWLRHLVQGFWLTRNTTWNWANFSSLSAISCYLQPLSYSNSRLWSLFWSRRTGTQTWFKLAEAKIRMCTSDAPPGCHKNVTLTWQLRLFQQLHKMISSLCWSRSQPSAPHSKSSVVLVGKYHAWYVFRRAKQNRVLKATLKYFPSFRITSSSN